MNEKIQQYKETFNLKKDYVECHHISRDMLLNGEDQALAKTLATLSALAEQVNKERWSGYHKLYKKLVEQLQDLESFPFDREDLSQQLSDLDQRIKREENIKSVPIQLKE
ncbi:hypothetical protein [Pontibacillus marinus]|uniref:Uncharacterized protein n=1 Tax=Pontibacillus marinus BH030004 = DSM 16465 TaxID=1385511 RepID=A0A0A5FWW8_9BACI|nr:hypothetical protein [Pontibacillus marinus]KGX84404.1 hypothetical protein N783_17640 [Pontibacillus marinus BH030004 = DSM 16465]